MFTGRIWKALGHQNAPMDEISQCNLPPLRQAPTHPLCPLYSCPGCVFGGHREFWGQRKGLRTQRSSGGGPSCKYTKLSIDNYVLFLNRTPHVTESLKSLTEVGKAQQQVNCFMAMKALNHSFSSMKSVKIMLQVIECWCECCGKAGLLRGKGETWMPEAGFHKSPHRTTSPWQ